MTHEDILLVQLSWRKVLPIKDVAADLFYLKLFELDPALRLLFRVDMEQQGAKLMQMITAAVRGLDRLDALLPVVRELGTRHVAAVVVDLAAVLERDTVRAGIQPRGALAQAQLEPQLREPGAAA